jgi:hypothetical protein
MNGDEARPPAGVARILSRRIGGRRASEVTTSDLRARIDAMFARDIAAASTFVVALWIVIGFVLFEVADLAGPAITSVLLIGGPLVVLFNTASITAMVRHYRSEKNHIYGLDIEHLDARRGNSLNVPAVPTTGERTVKAR